MNSILVILAISTVASLTEARFGRQTAYDPRPFGPNSRPEDAARFNRDASPIIQPSVPVLTPPTDLSSRSEVGNRFQDRARDNGNSFSPSDPNDHNNFRLGRNDNGVTESAKSYVPPVYGRNFLTAPYLRSYPAVPYGEAPFYGSLYGFGSPFGGYGFPGYSRFNRFGGYGYGGYPEPYYGGVINNGYFGGPYGQHSFGYHGFGGLNGGLGFRYPFSEFSRSGQVKEGDQLEAPAADDHDQPDFPNFEPQKNF